MLDKMDSMVMARVNEFHLRHGGECLNIGNWLAYPNGANRDMHPMGLLMEPSKDPLELAKMKLAYREKHLRLAVEDFNDLKNALTMQVHQAQDWAVSAAPPPPPCEAEIARLKALQGIVHERQKALEAARAEVEACKPDEQRMREERAAMNAPVVAAAADAVAAIKI